MAKEIMGELTATEIATNGGSGETAVDRRRPVPIGAQGQAHVSAAFSAADFRRELNHALEGIEFSTPSGAEKLAEAARYALLGGGKRVRPVLVAACAQTLGAPLDRVLPTACAIELLHTNSLIVDDLPAMDNHAKRRGRPTLHRLYGDDIAILAGCALLSEAQRLILEDQPGSAELRNRALGIVLGATGTVGMVSGQFLDVTKYRPDDRNDLERMQMLKTGSLIVACVRCGSMLSGGLRVDALDRFAESLGSLFQVVDDILDETGKARWLGKLPGSDRRAGKLTHVTMYGLASTRQRAAELHESCLACLAEMETHVPGPVGPLREITDMVYRRES